MLAIPNCWRRKCRYFIGVKQEDGTEATEVNYCKAFPEGIPEEIAYGDNLHTKVHALQKNTITYEKVK